jgi:hypothetical protein
MVVEDGGTRFLQNNMVSHPRNKTSDRGGGGLLKCDKIKNIWAHFIPNYANYLLNELFQGILGLYTKP